MLEESELDWNLGGRVEFLLQLSGEQFWLHTAVNEALGELALQRTESREQEVEDRRAG